jgi:hypothetical protein
MRRFVFAATALAVLLGGGAFALASIPDGSGVLHGCYTTKDGSLRLIDTDLGQSCTTKEHSVSWNEAGPPGPAGIASTTLPSGATLRGLFVADQWTDTPISAGALVAVTTISFPLSLSSPPVPHYLAPGDATSTDCPGSASDPEAAPGQLCVYASSSPSTAFNVFANPADYANGPTSAYGTELIFHNNATTNITQAGGSWAVTAP